MIKFVLCLGCLLTVGALETDLYFDLKDKRSVNRAVSNVVRFTETHKERVSCLDNIEFFKTYINRENIISEKERQQNISNEKTNDFNFIINRAYFIINTLVQDYKDKAILRDLVNHSFDFIRDFKRFCRVFSDTKSEEINEKVKKLEAIINYAIESGIVDRVLDNEGVDFAFKRSSDNEAEELKAKNLKIKEYLQDLEKTDPKDFESVDSDIISDSDIVTSFEEESSTKNESRKRKFDSISTDSDQIISSEDFLSN